MKSISKKQGGGYVNFENLLNDNKCAIERYVYFRVSNREDAEDILQETYLTAFEKFGCLNDEKRFKNWIIKIAKNKCNDYYRNKNIDIISNYDFDLCASKSGINESFELIEIINLLNDNEREILNLYYFLGYSQSDISKILNIPVGTVKSRLHSAKNNFKSKYMSESKGDINMSLPNILPDYKIAKLDKKPFAVKCSELMGWLIIPKLNEKLEWALYDFPSKKQTEKVKLEVVGKAVVHDIEGVEIVVNQYNPSCKSNKSFQRKFVAQLTDTHCRFLAESHKVNDVNYFYTFLDDNEFTKNWGYGDDNCGKETNLSQKGIVKRNGDNIISDTKAMDIVGRYVVEINGKTYDTVCLIDVETYDDNVVTEQYIDQNGRTVLWRRFNANDYKFEKYNQLWSEKLPENEKIKVNNKIYVHWYDCISSYIM